MVSVLPDLINGNLEKRLTCAIGDDVIRCPNGLSDLFGSIDL